MTEDNPTTTQLAEKTLQIGTDWKKEEAAHGEVFLFRHEPKALYAWDQGEAMTGYFKGLKAGKILGRSCKGCGRVMAPPRMFCEVCFRDTDDWVRLCDTGTINTWSVCFVTWDMKRVAKPQIPAVIEIDGTRPRMGIMHLVDVPKSWGPEGWKKLQVGTKVRAVFKPRAQRKGAVTDIRFFQVIG